MHFTKMHGLGNDFIIVEDIDDRYKDYNAMALKLCDRHFGIGADGLLVVKNSSVAYRKMLIFNSDGSGAEMCGNGLRCFARYLSDRGYVAGDHICIETLDGVRDVELVRKNDKDTWVKVNMGKPKLNPDLIPSVIKPENGIILDEPITVETGIYRVTSMFMGVPHTVLFVDNFDVSEMMRIGPQIEKSEFFPQRTNVNFVCVVNRDEFKVRTWERGAGLTLACGTGTCASIVACVLNKKTERKATARLFGGDMVIEWAEDGNVYMTGPAENVFTGEYSGSNNFI